MTRPEWSMVEQGLQSCRIACFSLAIKLVALGILGGIDLCIPIGREQQARLGAWPVGLEEVQGWRPLGDRSDPLALRLLPPARLDSADPHGSIEIWLARPAQG